MSTLQISGTVVDETAAGISQLVVEAADTGGVLPNVQLLNTSTAGDAIFPGYARTDASGNFTIACDVAGPVDLVIRIFDSVKRLLAETQVVSGVTGASYVVPSISMPRARAEGWQVTEGEAIVQQMFNGNSIKFLIDNEDAWKEIALAIQGAKDTINMMLFYLDIPNDRAIFTPDPPDTSGAGPTGGVLIEDALLTANQTSGVIVRLAVNDDQPFIPADSSRAVAKFFSDPANQPNTVEVRKFETPVALPIHAKLLLIDNTKAFLIGSPFVQEYYDGSLHNIDEPRRGSCCACFGQIGAPIHDVTAVIEGPAVAALNETFWLHWNKAGTFFAPPTVNLTAQGANVSLQIVRSIPGGRFSGLPKGEKGIFEAYLRAIRNATDFIYIENQYVTCDEMMDALILALKQSLTLQVIMALNTKLDIPKYTSWQHDAVSRLLSGLTDAERQRIELFTLWTHEDAQPPETRSRILRTYIHTKYCIVDDKWLTGGSANMDSLSLIQSQHVAHYSLVSSYVARQLDAKEARETDLNTVVFDGIDGQPASGVVADLRKRLWAEHLGLRPISAELDTRPAEGWLKLWKDKAQQKLDGLSTIGADPITTNAARVLRYPHQGAEVPGSVHKTEVYLSALGIDTDRMIVEKNFKGFSFAKGKWA